MEKEGRRGQTLLDTSTQGYISSIQSEIIGLQDQGKVQTRDKAKVPSFTHFGVQPTCLLNHQATTPKILTRSKPSEITSESLSRNQVILEQLDTLTASVTATKKLQDGLTGKLHHIALLQQDLSQYLQNFQSQRFDQSQSFLPTNLSLSSQTHWRILMMVVGDKCAVLFCFVLSTLNSTLPIPKTKN